MSETDPNRFASQQEASLIREALAADEDDMHGLQQRTERVKGAFSRAESALREAEAVISSAKVAYEHARALEISLQEEMQRKRGLLHPARKVPDEIWTMIFSDAVDQSSRFIQYGRRQPSKGAQSMALVVSSVSKRWRAIAQSHGQLWRFIHLELTPSWTEETIRLAQGSMQKRFSTYLYRLIFELELVVRKGVTHDRRFESLFYTLSRLLPHARSIHVWAADARIDFHDSLLSHYFHKTTPSLESLVLESEDCEHELDEDELSLPAMDPTYYSIFFPNCPRLRSVELGNFSVQAFVSSTPAAPNIQHVNIWNSTSLSDDDMNDALAFYPSAPTCRLYSPRLLHEGPWSATVTPHTQLRSLMIEANQVMDVDFCITHTFPNLHRVTFRNVAFDSHPSALSVAIARFVSRSCPHVSRLKLTSIAITGPLLSAMRALPQLRTVNMDYCSLRDGALFATPTYPSVFPALKRLFLSECECANGFSGQTLLDFARSRCSKHRRDDTGVPLLKHLGVSWNCDPESKTHAVDLVDDWDTKFADAAGGSSWSDTSDEDELEDEFMAYDD